MDVLGCEMMKRSKRVKGLISRLLLERTKRQKGGGAREREKGRKKRIFFSIIYCRLMASLAFWVAAIFLTFI